MADWWNGIHRRLKISRRKPCGFESRLSYYFERKKMNGYTKGDLVHVEGWAKPSLFVDWTKQLTYRGNDEPTPEFAVLLHNGELREVHVDYMIRVKEYEAWK